MTCIALNVRFCSNPCYAPGQSCNTTQCITGFANFASAAAAHFKGNGIIFECLNEPNGMGQDNPAAITALCLGAGAAFSAVGEYFVGPATSGIDFNYLNQTMRMGILKAFSAVSVHPYRPSPPDTVLDDYAQLRALIASYTPAGQTPLPVISGEWGYTTAGPTCGYSNKQRRQYQAAFAARMWLTNVLDGVNISILYDWKDDGSDPLGCEDNFGTIYNLTAIKPAYQAALTLQTTIGNSPASLGRVTSAVPSNGQPQNTFVTAFAPAEPVKTPMFAVWTNGTLAANGQCSGFDNVIDCGYYGIDEGTCVDKRGCCWAANPGGGPQCFRGA